jgi:hypothetical protein
VGRVSELVGGAIQPLLKRGNTPEAVVGTEDILSPPFLLDFFKRKPLF